VSARLITTQTWLSRVPGGHLIAAPLMGFALHLVRRVSPGAGYC
jgi:hypothetical protein